MKGASFVTLCFLHVCGGDPDFPDSATILAEFSPRMWR
ncbi:hypothetical protein CDA67_00807 [Lactobacillus acidophilus]|nr:hypothetical protein CDA67_00807 [Lactobacillus acidophilus]